eukprot:g2382.t1
MSQSLKGAFFTQALLTLCSFSFIECITLPEDLPNAYRPVVRMEDLVRPLGYPFEKHTVHTEDGYRLEMYRIPHGRSGVKPIRHIRRPVVFLQHGMLDSSAAFAMNGVNGSIAFTLADVGFDVWLGNSRGNTFSNFQIQKTMSYKHFWDFSLDELITYDLPSSLEYVLKKTSVQKLIYLGHSQGTAIAHALLGSGHPIVEHIALGIMLAPVAFVKHMTSPILRGLAHTNVEKLLNILGLYEFLPTQELLHILGGTFCKDYSFACENGLAAFAGYNPDNIDPEKWETFLKYTPAGTSVKLMVHWKQGVLSTSNTQFRAYDYGLSCWNWLKMEYQPCNQVIYKARVPPEYKIEDIRVPLVFFEGGHDILADPYDVESMKSLLKPGVLIDEYYYPDYQHLDFIWGKNADEKVCRKILDLLRNLFGSNLDIERPIKQY